MQTVFEWVTVGVSWLVIVAGGLAVVAGLLYMTDVLVTRIVRETTTLTILFDFVKNREDFRKYRADRRLWEEERIKAIRGYWDAWDGEEGGEGWRRWKKNGRFAKRAMVRVAGML